MNRLFASACLCIVCFVITGFAQININKSAIGIPLGKPTGAAPFLTFNVVQCVSIPTTAPSFFDKYYYLDTDVAAKIGIHWNSIRRG